MRQLVCQTGRPFPDDAIPKRAHPPFILPVTSADYPDDLVLVHFQMGEPTDESAGARKGSGRVDR